MTRLTSGRKRSGRLGTGLASAALVVLAGAALEAHHGRDFLLARTAELPHPGQIFVAPRQDVVRQEHQTSIELEPSAIFGVHERVAVEIHSHIAREDPSGLRYESTAPAVHFRFTPDTSAWAAGGSVEYEISRDDGARNRLETRAALSRQTPAGRMAVNIFAGHGGLDEDTGVVRDGLDWNYAAGMRRRIRGAIDWGFEAQGELAHGARHELLTGVYTEPSTRTTVNVGVGVGVGPDAPGFTIRTALIFRLR